MNIVEDLFEGMCYWTRFEIPLKYIWYVTLNHLLIGYRNDIETYHTEMYSPSN